MCLCTFDDATVGVESKSLKKKAIKPTCAWFFSVFFVVFFVRFFWVGFFCPNPAKNVENVRDTNHLFRVHVTNFVFTVCISLVES